MNKTKIDWCDSTWNPITGCLHGCEYCYARKQTQRFMGFYDSDLGENNLIPTMEKDIIRCRFDLEHPKQYMTKRGELISAPYPYGFAPTFHRYRLDEYANKKGRTIFVCSMADLFGEWVSDEWIREVFAACEAAPQHRYLFLTKNPQRYNDLLGERILPTDNNYWYGGTRTGQDSEREYEAAMSGNIFLSVEPMLAPMEPATLNAIDCWGWVIIGAETGNRKNKIIPEREWIENIVAECKRHGILVFMKSSLADIWGEPLIQEFPWKSGDLV